MLTRVCWLAALLAAGMAGQSFEYWPGAKYDPAIPSPKQVLGYDFGDRISWSANVVKYYEALAAAAPGRMKMWDYAKSWEGRRLVYAAIGSEANVKRLPAIQAAMKKLSDPRKTTEAEARKLMEGLPTVVWLAYGVHGNEISSPDAAMVTAYHLLASRGDAMVDSILANTVVILNPAQNPDGRDRFVHHYEISEGLEPDADTLAAEHNETWLSGRTNHYYFDLNRDWLAATQPETKGHIKALLEWRPQVFVDLHEMGSESSYYFAPEAVPYNPHLVKEQKDSLTWFGKNNAKYFDRFGFSYFTREVYDAFYPGYGASWPSYFGALAMTYENGSTRGLLVKQSDETLVSYRTTVRRHFTTSIATCETAAMHRKELLDNFRKYHVTAIEEGSREAIREYVLPRRGNVSSVDRLALLLAGQGVEVSRATAAFGGYPAGSYQIKLAQPSKRLIRTLLDPVVAMDDKFLADEEKRRKRKLGSEIYDVTAWSLPLQFNVECIAGGAVSTGSFEPVTAVKGKVEGIGSVAYLVPWGTTAAGRFLTAALRRDVRVYSSDKPFTLDGTRYPAGTLILKSAGNIAGLADAVRKLAEDSGAEVTGVDSSWVDDGPNFGSRHVQFIKKVRIALAWDRPTQANAAGSTRFVIERQFGYPVTVVRTAQLATADLSKFQVIILPDGGGFGDNYAAVLGVGGAKRLKDWAQAGGTLIGIGGAVQFLADSRNSLLAISQENAAGPEPPKKADAADAGRVPGKLIASDDDFAKATRADSELPDSLHGVLVRAKVDQEHWLTAGVAPVVQALYSGRAIYTPVKMDKGFNAAVFAAPDQVLASGYMWSEFKNQLAYKPLVVVQKEGRGNLIAFTADPNYRAYMDGLNVLLLNAIFRGPSH